MLPALFALTMFVGAASLFLVQPLVGKLLLPILGGTPGLWNACMVFFQTALLAGYLYAHQSTLHLGVRRQSLTHLLLLAAVLVGFALSVMNAGSVIPIVSSLVPTDVDFPLVGIIKLLAVAVGVPFFVLSTTAPLVQRWFAATGHASARDPYYLYAASNAGSLLGLLGYPLLLEPRLPLSLQQWVWAGSVLIYVLLVLVCALVTALGSPSRTEIREPELHAPLSTRRILRWLVLAALPSSLLLGVTAHISTDLAPDPLLWVVPLTLYLLSFILVFSRWPDSLHCFVGRFTPMLLIFVVVSLLTGAAEPLGLVIGLHLGAFFGICLLCHGELAKDRPPATQLTAFYFWLSLGGVFGGLANALAAPLLFQRFGILEYPIAIVFAAAVRPRDAVASLTRLRWTDFIAVGGLFGLTLGLVLLTPHYLELPREADSPDALSARLARSGLMFGVPAVLAFALVRKSARFALALGALFLAGAFAPNPLGETLLIERNFFGVLRVTRSADGRFINLVHGTTLHGRQRADEPRHPRPMTYYHQRGPIGRVFATLPPERTRRVGIVGLGTGALAYYARPGEIWTFYEIDPAVVRIAHDERYFTFLAECQANSCDMVLGDARRELMKADNGVYDVMVLDAFSSDAIPTHLLTREALQLYIAKLAPCGVLAMHISNNHLDLPPLVARLAADHNPPLAVRYCHDNPTDQEREDGKTASQWVVLARRSDDLAVIVSFRQDGKSKPLAWDQLPLVPGPVWSDDFANLLGVWKREDE